MAAIWRFIPGVPGLDRVQIGTVAPVPGRAHGAVHQHRSRSGHLAEIGHEPGEDLADQRAQQVPALAHGGLADPEDLPGDLLGEVRAQQRHHQRHRREQAQGVGAAPGDQPSPAGGVHPGHHLGELLLAQSRHRRVPQRLLHDDLIACLVDNATTQREAFFFQRDTHHKQNVQRS